MKDKLRNLLRGPAGLFQVKDNSGREKQKHLLGLPLCWVLGERDSNKMRQLILRVVSLGFPWAQWPACGSGEQQSPEERRVEDNQTFTREKWKVTMLQCVRLPIHTTRKVVSEGFP